MSNDSETRLIDRDYHLKRADTARAMAAASPDASARRAHQAMADEHLNRAAAKHPSSLKQVRE